MLHLMLRPSVKRATRATHARLAGLPGTEQIASAHALNGAMVWTWRRRPESIVEFGAGPIGTLTATIGGVCLGIGGPHWILAVEPDEACRARLTRLLAPSRIMDMVTIVEHPERAQSAVWDMLVVDGCEPHDVERVPLRHRAVIFVEGGRRAYREAIEASLRRRGRLWARLESRPLDRTKGYWVYQLEPIARERFAFAVLNALQRGLDLLAKAHGRPIGKKRGK